MVEDYLNIVDNFILLANTIDVEIDQKIEEIATDFTDGSIPFAESGFLEENNTKLFWDNVFEFLGIGTTTPNAELDVNGDIIGDSITLNDSTASRLAALNANKKIISTHIAEWITGTTSQIVRSTSGAGTTALSFDSPTKIGTAANISSGNYTEIKEDGEIELYGTARVKKTIPITNAHLGKGTIAPAQVIIGNYNGWEYDIGDDSTFNFRIPKDWASGTDIDIKFDWAINEAYATNSGEVRFKITYTATPSDETEAIDVAGTTINSSDIDIPATAYYLTNDYLTIPESALSVGDVVGVDVERIAIVDGTDPTANPVVIDVFVDYIANKIGRAT